MPTGSGFTDKELALIRDAKNLMPERFRGTTGEDGRVLQFLELVVADINAIPPAEYLTIEFLPTNVIPIIRFGASFYSAVFFQLRATLDDFTWSDQGVTVAIDQTAKINTALMTMTKTYERLITNYKKTRVIAQGGRGLGTPRYQSQLGQFLKIALGSSFLFNTF